MEKRNVVEEWRYIEGSDRQYRVSNMGAVERCFHDHHPTTGEEFLAKTKPVTLRKCPSHNPIFESSGHKVKGRLKQLVYNHFAIVPAPKGAMIYFVDKNDKSCRFDNLTLVQPDWYHMVFKKRGRKPKVTAKVEDILPYRQPKHISGRVPRIVSAAMRWGKLVIACPRHNDITFSNILSWVAEQKGDAIFAEDLAGTVFEHGFIDQFGLFYDKKVALRIAQICGQVTDETKKHPYDILLPDDLY